MTEEFDANFFLDLVEGDENRSTLSFARSPAVLFTFAANRYSRLTARAYQERYGIGIMDWRMLVMLTREPGSTISHSSNVIGIDKGAVSRCVQRLETLGLVHKGELHANGRSRSWWLTKRGEELHDGVLSDALARHRKLFTGFSESQIKCLNEMLLSILSNMDRLEADTDW